MKKAAFLFILFLLTGWSAFAQMHISTTLREEFGWNEASQQWVHTGTDQNEQTFFDFSKELTMFKHTTPTMTSSYNVTNRTYNDATKIMEFDVTSDVGNKYHVILDPNASNIRFIGMQSGKSYMVRHTIKKIWND